MRRRRSPRGIPRRTTPPTLTNVGRCGMMSAYPSPIYSPSAVGDTSTSPPKLSEPEWQKRVELLLHMSPEDFEAAVAAVRLHRRLERR